MLSEAASSGEWRVIVPRDAVGGLHPDWRRSPAEAIGPLSEIYLEKRARPNTSALHPHAHGATTVVVHEKDKDNGSGVEKDKRVTLVRAALPRRKNSEELAGSRAELEMATLARDDVVRRRADHLDTNPFASEHDLKHLAVHAIHVVQHARPARAPVLSSSSASSSAIAASSTAPPSAFAAAGGSSAVGGFGGVGGFGMVLIGRRSVAGRAVVDDFGDWLHLELLGAGVLGLRHHHQPGISGAVLAYFGCHVCDCDASCHRYAVEQCHTALPPAQFRERCEESIKWQRGVRLRLAVTSGSVSLEAGSRNLLGPAEAVRRAEAYECTYCGLSAAHHLDTRPVLGPLRDPYHESVSADGTRFYTRELFEADIPAAMAQTLSFQHPDIIRREYDAASHTYSGRPFLPQDMYAKHRCPIQRCANASCGAPFVKIRWNHLCTTCRVAFLQLPRMRQLWRPVHMHQYVDELYSVLCDRIIWEAVRRYDSWKQLFTIPKSGGRVGSRNVTRRYVDIPLLQSLFERVLRVIETRCVRCNLLFRCSLLDGLSVPPYSRLCGFCAC